jgi:hypothetical protein
MGTTWKLVTFPALPQHEDALYICFISPHVELAVDDDADAAWIAGRTAKPTKS